MEFAAIVEQRTTHWYVHIPALSTGGALPHRDNARACAIALVAAATGVPPGDPQVSLHNAAPGQTLLPTSPTDVDVRHDDGVWRTAQHTGWLRQWHGSWRPLVSYAADGVTWTRAVHISRFRPPEIDTPAVPAPVSAEPASLSRSADRQARSAG